MILKTIIEQVPWAITLSYLDLILTFCTKRKCTIVPQAIINRSTKCHFMYLVIQHDEIAPKRRKRQSTHSKALYVLRCCITLCFSLPNKCSDEQSTPKSR